MKVKDIIKLSARLLCENDIVDCIKYCEENEMTLTEFFALKTQTALPTSEDYIEIPECFTLQAEKDMRIILDCINIANLYICTEKYLRYSTEEIEITNGEYEIKNLSQKLFKIKQLSNNYGFVKYYLEAGKIILPNGKYTIKYAYLPTELGFDDDIDTFNGKLTNLALSYGVCSKFCLIKNLFDEADEWESKFSSSLAENFRKVGEIKIKQRRWI